MDNLSLTANFPMGRRDHQSRSPRRQAYQDDSRGRDSSTRYRDDDMHNERPYGSSHGRYEEEGYARRGAPSRPTRDYPQEEYDYRGMYDDGYQGQGQGQGHGEPAYGHDRFEEPRYRSNPSHYRDPDAPRSHSPYAHGSHDRSRSDSPSRDAGRPSDTVILEGLPFGVSTSELRDSLLSNSIAAEYSSFDLRISASKGNRRAFVQFEQLDHAMAFVTEHFPKLLIPLTQPTDDVPAGKFDVFIHYAHSREPRDIAEPRVSTSLENWTCPQCDFSNYSTRSRCKICGTHQAPLPIQNWQASLTGVTDAADVPSQILVVYPIPAFVNEEMFTNDVKKLEVQKPDPSKETSNGSKLKSTAPTGNAARYGARIGSLHRTFLMREIETNESFKYGFAEFWTLEDASAAMAKVQMSKAFTVAACPVTVSTIHTGVFVPEDRRMAPAIEHQSFHPLFNPNLRVRYWDLHVYPSQTVVTTEPPGGDTLAKPNTIEDTAEAKKTKKRKADASLASAATKKAPMAGTMAMWQRKRDELRGGPGSDGGNGEAPSQDATADDQSRAPVRISMGGSGNAAKTGTQGTIKISLSSAAKLSAPAPTSSEMPATEPIVAQSAAPEAAQESYLDRDRLMCLICMRKYKSIDEVNIHEKSRNHKNASENEDLVKAALPRLAIRDKRIQKQKAQQEASNPAPQYRDRAKERREAFNQPVKPTVPSGPSSAQPAKPKAEEAAPPPPAQSKGAGMLAKMGWTAGAGLGANGDGRTDVVETNAYQEGVGLGAEGGKLGDAAELAERKTKNSYAEYVSSVQDRARERYNRMG